MRRRARGLVCLLAGASAALAVAGACFSERSATGPVEGSCRLPVQEGVPGSVLAGVTAWSALVGHGHVHAGQTVTWVNCEESATSHTTHGDGDEWSSPLLAPGAGFSHRFDRPGTFDYQCDPHPFMTGRVVVE